MSDKPKINPQTPAPKTQAAGGSLTNMPSDAEIKHWVLNEKPKVMAGIQESWAKIKTAAKRMNGAILMNDRMGN